MDKSNNFEFMSNIPKDVLELTKEICPYKPVCNDVCNPLPDCVAMLYAWRTINAGYRKQSEGEWEVCGMFDDFLRCSVCGDKHPWQTAIEYRFCPNCGAKMKGGE